MAVPSRLETFGQTASEAHACGTPVVAFNTGGLADIVAHRETGYLATPFDAQDLATGIEWVLAATQSGPGLGKRRPRPGLPPLGFAGCRQAIRRAISQHHGCGSGFVTTVTVPQFRISVIQRSLPAAQQSCWSTVLLEVGLGDWLDSSATTSPRRLRIET